MKRHRIPIAVAAAAVLLGGGCVRERNTEPESTQAAPAASSAAPAAPVEVPLDSRTRGWSLGQWYAYALQQSTAISFGTGGKMLDFDLEGLLQITPTAVTAETTTLYVAIAHPRITSRLPEGQAELDKVAEQLGGPGVFLL